MLPLLQELCSHFLHITFPEHCIFLEQRPLSGYPFCALFLMKTVKEGGIKNPVLAGIFFILVGMSDLQYLIFMGVFAGLVFLYDFYMTLSSGKNLTSFCEKNNQKVLFFGGVTFFGVLPLAINEILIALSNQNFLKPSAAEIPNLSNDLMSFFLPSHLHTLFGQFTSGLYSNLPSWFAEKSELYRLRCSGAFSPFTPEIKEKTRHKVLVNIYIFLYNKHFQDLSYILTVRLLSLIII